MSLTEEQVKELIGKIQYIIDHPNQVDWEKIHDIFKQLLKNGIEFGEPEIQHLQKNLKFNDDSNANQFYAIVDTLCLNFTVTKDIESEIPRFENENPELVECLNTLMFKSFLNSNLTYPPDYWTIITQFE